MTVNLSRRPVLVALMVYSVGYGAAAFAVWREATGISNQRQCEKHYLVRSELVRSETPGLRVYVAIRRFLI